MSSVIWMTDRLTDWMNRCLSIVQSVRRYAKKQDEFSGSSHLSISLRPRLKWCDWVIDWHHNHFISLPVRLFESLIGHFKVKKSLNQSFTQRESMTKSLSRQSWDRWWGGPNLGDWLMDHRSRKPDPMKKKPEFEASYESRKPEFEASYERIFAKSSFQWIH